MAGTWNPSWISGKYAYTFASDYAKITANTTLDITGSFRLGFQLKFDQLFLTGTIWSKSTGNVNDPTVTSYNIHSINGYLRVMISNGTKFLVYDTPERFFATYKAVQVDIVWDSVNKELRVYKDAVNKTITLNTSNVLYYTSPASFTTLLTTPTADLNFGKGQGQESFKGTLGGAIFSARTFTSPEIYSYFLGKEDTVSTPPATEILYTSDQSGINNIHKMYEDGSLPTQIISSTDSLSDGNWNSAKNKITYTNRTNNFVYTKNLISNANIRNSPSYVSVFNPIDETKIACIFSNRIGDSISRVNFANPDALDSYETAITPNHDLGSGFTYTNELFTRYSRDGLINAVILNDLYPSVFSRAIAIYNNTLTKASLKYVYEISVTSPFSDQIIDSLDISPDNSKIIFSKLKPDGSTYQIYSINVNGTDLTQLTAEPYNCIKPIFSPDGTKIAFAMRSGSGGTKYQMYLMNNNGSNIIRVSNNAYNEYPSDWK